MPGTLARKKLIRSPSPPRRRQEERTEATRRRLLQAAERIFAQDGFEASRLEDIVALAGYTRGAFYAHYESKEDLLLDLMERFVNEKVRNLRAILGAAENSTARWQALRAHYSRMACDRRWTLLTQLLQDLGRQLPFSIHAAMVALGATANSLLIESLVDPKALAEDEIPVLLSLVFDAVLGVPSQSF
jgi:AcrR family transcriptional regulator